MLAVCSCVALQCRVKLVEGCLSTCLTVTWIPGQLGCASNPGGPEGVATGTARLSDQTDKQPGHLAQSFTVSLTQDAHHPVFDCLPLHNCLALAPLPS